MWIYSDGALLYNLRNNTYAKIQLSTRATRIETQAPALCVQTTRTFVSYNRYVSVCGVA